MYVVILAGGAGTRFWPLSRRRQPKQLMSVFGGRSMLQRTVERILPLQPRRILVVTNVLQAAETVKQLEYLQDIPIDVIAEPEGRNTAPAVGLAAALIARHDPGALMLVLPADHYIRDEEKFRAALLRVQAAARQGALMTLGIRPDRPETGYGYIEAGRDMGAEGVYPVTRFVEKPPLAKALEFLAAGNFFWNSGMFVWQAGRILAEIEKQMPELHAGLMRLHYSGESWLPDDLLPQVALLYREVKSQSIDYGVMEKAENVGVIPGEFGWSDVGSWRALPELIEPDEAGNVLVDAHDSVLIDSRDCLVHGGGKLIALVGAEKLIVIRTGDALLICAKDRAQEVKQVVEELERRGLTEYY